MIKLKKNKMVDFTLGEFHLPTPQKRSIHAKMEDTRLSLPPLTPRKPKIADMPKQP